MARLIMFCDNDSGAARDVSGSVSAASWQPANRLSKRAPEGGAGTGQAFIPAAAGTADGRSVPSSSIHERSPGERQLKGTCRALSRRGGDRELGADKHKACVGVVWLGNGREGELADRAWAEDKTVSRAAELEVTEFLALRDVVAGDDIRVDDAR